MSPDRHSLYAVEMGIDTHQEPVVYMREDCAVCRSEGFTSNTRVRVIYGTREILATLDVVQSSVLPHDSIGFSNIAWQRLQLQDQATVQVAHAPVLRSLSAVRKKIYGNDLSDRELTSIIDDISAHLYTDIEIASFLTACAGDRMSVDEIVSLTEAMVKSGKQLHWPGHDRIFDKHCIGGLPGNRTTPIVIAICSAAGLTMPKTSSRAITSPAGTADTMEVITHVNLSLEEMREVVEKAGACLAWGGAVNLSPADDILIRIERALELDGEGQLVASVLSKKIAAGSNHVLIDIPVGDTAKVRSTQQAERLVSLFEAASVELGIKLHCIITDGSQAIGSGIGPAEEARDVLSVLQNRQEAPADLAERALLISAHLLAMAENCDIDTARDNARELLESGKAWLQFQRICAAQGGFKALPEAEHQRTFFAQRNGILHATDNRRLARLAKLAGAPASPVAGLRLHAKPGQSVHKGDPLFTLYSATKGQLEYVEDYFEGNRDLFIVGAAS